MSWQNLTDEQLEALSTQRLLAIYKLARTAARCYDWDCNGGECSCVANKARAENLKTMLDSRDHVDTGGVKITHTTKDRSLRETSGRRNNSWLRNIGDSGRSYRDLSWSEKCAIDDGEKVLTKEGRVRPAFGPIKDLDGDIGQQVYKTSGKPFKSKEKYNTVSGITTNPHTGRQAFTFEEDESVVDAHQCELRKK